MNYCKFVIYTVIKYINLNIYIYIYIYIVCVYDIKYSHSYYSLAEYRLAYVGIYVMNKDRFLHYSIVYTFKHAYIYANSILN